MSEPSSYSSNQAIRVQLDPEILRELIYGADGLTEAGSRSGDERARLDQQRICALREHQVYRLMRSLVSQFNSRLKGRRERFKLVEEGDGLVLEYSA